MSSPPKNPKPSDSSDDHQSVSNLLTQLSLNRSEESEEDAGGLVVVDENDPNLLASRLEQLSVETDDSYSSLTGLVFPIGKIAKFLHARNFVEHVDDTAAVYFAAVLEYLSAEMLEVSGYAAVERNKTRIEPHHIQKAVRKDHELRRLPNMHKSLFHYNHDTTESSDSDDDKWT